MISSDEVASVAGQILKDLDISSPILSVTIDNGSDVVCAMNRAQIPIFRCAAHSLQLGILAFLRLPAINPIIQKASRIVSHVRASKKRMDQLKKLWCDGHEGEKYHCPKLGNHTRWGGTYRMISTLLEHWHEMPIVCRELWVSSQMYLNHESLLLICSLLRPFASLHSCMQTRTKPSIPSTIPGLLVLSKKALPTPKRDLEFIVEGFLSTVISTVEQYVTSQLTSPTILGICALDIRYKDFTWTDYQSRVGYVIQARNWLRTEGSRFIQHPISDAVPAPEVRNTSQWISDMYSYDDVNHEDIDQETVDNTALNVLDDEIDCYFTSSVRLPTKDIFANFNALEWWKGNQTTYPLLAQVAFRWLKLPVTSSECEREFSSCGVTLSDLRNNMDPSTLSVLEFVGRNDRFYPGPSE